MNVLKAAASALFIVGAAGTALAQEGPVATACKADIAALCAGKSHQNREVRNCLEDNKTKVSTACKTALDSTGGGKGMGGMGGMRGMGGMGGMGGGMGK